MLSLKKAFYHCLRALLKARIKLSVLPDKAIKKQSHIPQPIFYVLHCQSVTDIAALQIACKIQHLPDPLSPVEYNGITLHRTICLNKPSIFFSQNEKTSLAALQQSKELLTQHIQQPSLNAQLIPVHIMWGRKTAKDKRVNQNTALSTPSRLKKMLIVLWQGGNTLLRFSDSIACQTIIEQHGNDEKIARKMLRIARIHFYKQMLAAKGPRLLSHQYMSKLLFASPPIKEIISQEAKNQSISEKEIKQKIQHIIDEIAGDYNNTMIRVGEKILGWLWKRLYKKIEINNTEPLRKIAQSGHEIIYIPCHRSHMDYLLLTYVIFHQGLVIPRIAAGINLNFWPAGPIFRKAGAFFIRRSFKGDRLYSTIFREYLSLLFERGYPVKYYAEGGRSRTGKLLPPKTGMVAMSIQSLLKGIDRPLTIVPVYLGYEHVMEVSTYHKELRGDKKKNESITGVFGAIKKLRNYGRGYINFGKPINVNKFLNQHAPNWKEHAINSPNNVSLSDQQSHSKPHWLTPISNQLAEQVMLGINKSSAINGVALTALALHASEHKALTKTTLLAQLDFLLSIQKTAPFSPTLTLPKLTAYELLEEVISLNKVEYIEDSIEPIITLSENGAMEMRYYRNNILHAYLLPSLVTLILQRHTKIKEDVLIATSISLISIIKNEYFIYHSKNEIKDHLLAILSTLAQQKVASKSSANYWTLTSENTLRVQAKMMAACINENLQRLTMFTVIIQKYSNISAEDIAKHIKDVAQRLVHVSNINTPEFIDIKAQNELLQTLKKEEYLSQNSQDEYLATAKLDELHKTLTVLLSDQVLNVIRI